MASQPVPSTVASFSKKRPWITALTLATVVALAGCQSLKLPFLTHKHSSSSTSWSKAELDDTLTGHTEGVGNVAISPDGETVASSSLDRTIKL